MRVYDMIMRRQRIMHVGSCMIIWRDKAALSGHKLNRCPLLLSMPPTHPSTPTHRDPKKRPYRSGTRTCSSTFQTIEPLFLSSYFSFAALYFSSPLLQFCPLFFVPFFVFVLLKIQIDRNFYTTMFY